MKRTEHTATAYPTSDAAYLIGAVVTVSDQTTALTGLLVAVRASGAHDGYPERLDFIFEGGVSQTFKGNFSIITH